MWHKRFCWSDLETAISLPYISDRIPRRNKQHLINCGMGILATEQTNVGVQGFLSGMILEVMFQCSVQSSVRTDWWQSNFFCSQSFPLWKQHETKQQSMHLSLAYYSLLIECELQSKRQFNIVSTTASKTYMVDQDDQINLELVQNMKSCLLNLPTLPNVHLVFCITFV